MGSVKQLLPYEGGTLLSHALREAQKASFERVVVVLGAHADQILPALGESGAEVVINSDWRTGMGSSIQAGLEHLLLGCRAPEVLGITLADQPYVTAAHLQAMWQMMKESDFSVIAAEYADQYGVPALFRRETFSLLRGLSPAAGARQILRNTTLRIKGFALPEAEIDIDTPSDLAQLTRVRP